MDFFAHQDRTRKNSLWLILLFVIAVILVAASVYFALLMSLNLVIFIGNIWEPAAYDLPYVWINWTYSLIIFIVTILVIIQACVIKIGNLAGGGSAVAEKLGGRRLHRTPEDRQAKILQNVVEEMAIASGVPVPQIYLLEKEKGINAFTAGDKLSNAAVAVTQGALEALNRHELQGIVAHEFSHILNGDMRINIRLVGYLFGITVIGRFGKWIWDLGSTGRKRGHVIHIFAGALIAVGSIGALIARIVQCAVSRQREFLADATAVQFTRNPEGVTGALKKIGRSIHGSRILSRNAPEICHMFFCMAIKSMLATHPPLDERIRRIEPMFKGKRIESGFLQYQNDIPEQSWKKFDPSVSTMAMGLKRSKNHVGSPVAAHIQYSSDLLGKIPQKINNELDSMLGATAVVCALLLDRDPMERNNQFKALQKYAPPELYTHVRYLEETVRKIASVYYLPLVELVIPTLRCLSPAQFAALKRYLQALIEADGKLALFEFVLKKMITYQLQSNYRRSPIEQVISNKKQLTKHVLNLLSVLAAAGHKKSIEVQNAFNAGADILKSAGILQEASLVRKVSYTLVDTALNHLALATPSLKRDIYDCLCACVLYDENVTVQEAELLRMVASIMDIPVPPFVQKIFYLSA